MKKTTTILLVFTALLLLNTNVNAQAFQKGTINVDLGIGFGLYGTSYSHKETRTATVTAAGYPSNAIDYDRSRDTTDGALSTVIPFSFEYGVTDKIGAGVDFTYNSYFIGRNDTDNTDLLSVKAYDFGLKGYYHPFNSDFYDMSIGLGFGLSSIKWKTTNTGDDYSGSGFYVNLDIKNKFWFSEHIGAFLNIGYKGNFYSDITKDLSSEEAELEALSWVSNVTMKDEFSFTMHGVNLGVGLALKF